ncbi:MAG TPA: LysR family transcriptional regulator [Paenirhodobacter sp.]
MTSRLPSLHALRCFAVAGETLSFTKAAGELFLTQSAVSRQVQLLEQQLGFPLFRRLTRRLELTPQGQILLRHVKAAFLDIEQGVRAAAAYAGRPGITVAMPPTFAIRWGTTCLVEFQKIHPAMDVDLRIDSVGTALDDAQIDVGIEFIYEKHKRSDAQLLFCETLVPICSPGYAATFRDHQTAAFLRHANLLHVQQWNDRYGDWKNWLTTAGFGDVPYDRGMVFETADMVLSAAKQGAGIGIGDFAYIRDDLETGALIAPFQTSVSYDRGYFIKAREGGTNIGIKSAFVAFMIDMCAPLRQAGAHWA